MEVEDRDPVEHRLDQLGEVGAAQGGDHVERARRRGRRRPPAESIRFAIVRSTRGVRERARGREDRRQVLERDRHPETLGAPRETAASERVSASSASSLAGASGKLAAW